MTEIWRGIDPAEAETRLDNLYKRMSQLESVIESQSKLLQDEPNSFAYRMMYGSLISEQKNLQIDLNNLLIHRISEKIECHLNGPHFENSTALFDTLAAFLRFSQRLFSSIAHAITKGPTRRGRIPEEIIQLTQLKLVAMPPGSFGLKIVIPSRLDLIGESPVIETLNKMFQLLDTGSEEEILLDQAGELGTRAMNNYRLLVKELVKTETIPVLEWRTPNGEQKVWRPTYVGVKDTLERLHKLIEKSLDNKIVQGKLVGASLLRSSFEFISDDKEIIRGNVTKEALKKTPDFFGRQCEIIYSETTIVNSITGTERRSFTLSEIRELPIN